MTAREELAEMLHDNITDDLPVDPYRGEIQQQVEIAVDILIAAGFRKPHTITTVEELDAAIYAAFEEGGHLVVSDSRGRPWIIWGDEDGDEVVDSWPQEDDPERLTLSDITLPATVLHEPQP